MSSKFWLQTQAPAGNWVDNLGSDDRAACQSHGVWLRDCRGEMVRVIERTDKVLWAACDDAELHAEAFTI